MRDLRFRGLTTKGEMIEGSLVVTNEFINHMPKQHTKNWIVTSAFGNGGWFNIRGRKYVKPETVGQFTGLTDKNGVDIYEGDIVHAGPNNSNYTVCNGEYEISSHYDSSPHECVGFYLSRHNGLSFNECESIGGDCSDLKVIGNIHQHPELLK